MDSCHLGIYHPWDIPSLSEESIKNCLYIQVFFFIQKKIKKIQNSLANTTDDIP